MVGVAPLSGHACTVAAMHRNRRPSTLVVLATICLLVVSCGGESDESDTVPATEPTGEMTLDTIASEDPLEADEPTVEIPSEIPTELVITDLVDGTGEPAANGDTVYVFYVGVLSSDGTRFDGNYGSDPFPVTLGQGRVIQGWDEGLIGAKAGGRRQLDIPADLAYGDQGSGDVITPGSALSFVVDIVAVVPATDITGKPDVSVEGADNLDELEKVDLVVGDGAVAETGMTVAFHLVAFRGDTGEELDETWSTGEPVTTTLVEGGAIAGLVDGITGMKVGGRREIRIPYADAFGDAGQSDLGLPEKTDLVVVVDLLATF